MSKASEQALREFCENWRYDLFKNDGITAMLSDLTALIGEHYYPKGFTEWCIVNIESAPIKYRNRNGKIYLNITEIFKHWINLNSKEK